MVRRPTIELDRLHLAGITATEFMRAVPIHPTVSELVPMIFGELQP
jgi:hypothetical protein